jgi:hypothetical protein
MIKSKTHEAKNKVYKTHGAIMHLTLCNLGINTHKKKRKKKKKGDASKTMQLWE